MASVFVIEQGEYSDYHVVGVFSTRENAETVLAALKESTESYYTTPEIAEWPLDPAIDALRAGLKRFIVWMRKDGSVERIQPTSIAHYDGLGDSFHEWEREQAPAYRGKDIANVLQANVWAEDEKHAIKIVNERRIQVLAMGQWKGSK